MAEAIRDKQLHVVVDDAMGIGSLIFGALADAKVNVKGTCCWSMGGVAHFLIVPDELEAARKALRKAEFKVTTENVITVTLPNKPGAFSDLLGRLRKANVDVRLAYASAGTRTKALLVLMTESNAKALRTINRP
jgi:hypothetical protein